MIDRRTKDNILQRLSEGLKICEQPYRALAEEFDVNESELLDFIKQSQQDGTIKRLGMVVNHHQVGYSANAMVVWNVPDQQVDQIGELLATQDCITLCYQRPRRLPVWPYNLFTMIHGKSRAVVESQINQVIEDNQLQSIEKDILFSTKKFKQTGARYESTAA